MRFPNFLVPLTNDSPTTPLSIEHEQLAEPADYEDTEAVQKIEPTAEVQLAQLMERWKTGKPPINHSE